MCVDHMISCACGKNAASFHFKDDVLPVQAVARLYCPSCSTGTAFDPATMLSDNGWVIEYDMEIARFMIRNMPAGRTISPEFLFDEGYCTWRGIYPGDHLDSAREREELSKLAKTDPGRYFDELRSWAVTRAERLAREGWRKAHERETVNP